MLWSGNLHLNAMVRVPVFGISTFREVTFGKKTWCLVSIPYVINPVLSLANAWCNQPIDKIFNKCKQKTIAYKNNYNFVHRVTNNFWFILENLNWAWITYNENFKMQSEIFRSNYYSSSMVSTFFQHCGYFFYNLVWTTNIW